MNTKIVTAYWMDCEGNPFQGAKPIRKIRYQGSLISHCIGSNLPVVCYTHQKNFEELTEIKLKFNLTNLELKILELADVKFHKEINDVRNKNFDPDLDGRGPEIMWGKFDVLERELEGFDRVYWVDAGLQYPGLFPWMYSKVYSPNIANFGIPREWWNTLDVFNFSKLIDSNIYTKLDLMCNNKLAFVCSHVPQIKYPFQENGILSQSFESPYPVGGMFGGDVKVFKKYINLFWSYAKQMLEKESLCTEEVLMKPSYDLISDKEKIALTFDKYDPSIGGEHDEHDDHHYRIWNSSKNPYKPFYMVWHDILNFKI